MSDPKFVEFAGKKEYKCPKCKAVIRYAKFFGSDGKLLTTDGNEPYFDKDKKPMSNTGWPTDPNTQKMHECEKLTNSPATNETLTTINQIQTKAETEIKRTDLLDMPDYKPQTKELDFNDLGMESLRKEILQECAILWKEDEWITNYLKIKLGGESPNPAKVGMWHKLISERLARSHDSG